VTRSPEPGLEAGLLGEFGDGHRVCGDHSLPFGFNLVGPQRTQQQPRPADPHVPDTGFRVLPILRIHAPKIAAAMAAAEPSTQSTSSAAMRVMTS
jgi:hypothetical protein